MSEIIEATENIESAEKLKRQMSKKWRKRYPGKQAKPKAFVPGCDSAYRDEIVAEYARLRETGLSKKEAIQIMAQETIRRIGYAGDRYMTEQEQDRLDVVVRAYYNNLRRLAAKKAKAEIAASQRQAGLSCGDAGIPKGGR
jgi:pyruvate-formate lyase